MTQQPLHECQLYIQQLINDWGKEPHENCFCGNPIYAHSQQPDQLLSTKSHQNVVSILSRLSLPKFNSKSTAYTYLVKLEQLLNISGLDVSSWSKAFIYTAEEIFAAQWIQLNIIDKNLSWQESKHAFLEHFSKSDRSIYLHRKYRELKQQHGETVQQYADRFQNIITQIGYTDDQDKKVIDHYINGLNDTIFTEFQRLQVMNDTDVDKLSDAIAKCIKLDVFRSTSASRSQFISGKSSNSKHASHHQNKQYHCKNHPNTKNHSTQDCRLQLASTTSQVSVKVKEEKPPTCYKCGRIGHKSPECRVNSHQQSNSNTNNNPVVNSNRWNINRDSLRSSNPNLNSTNKSANHVDVTNTQSDDKNIMTNDILGVQSTILSATNPLPTPAFNGDMDCVLFIYDNKHIYRTLLDTGASHSFIDSDVVDQLNIQVNANHGTINLAHGGTSVKRIGMTNEIHISALFPLDTKNLPAIQINHAFEIMKLNPCIQFIIGRDLIHTLFPKGIPSAYIKRTIDDHTKNVNVNVNQSITEKTNLQPKLIDDMIGQIPDFEQPVRDGVSNTDDVDAHYEQQRETIRQQADTLIKINDSIIGFCALPESVIHLEIDPQMENKLFRKQYPIEHSLRPHVDEIIQRWMTEGKVTIAPPGCKYNSPLTCAPKKNAEGELTGIRICLDTRSLNTALITKDVFQLPKINEALEMFNQCCYFGEYDLQEAYLQFRLSDESQQLTAFQWGNTQYMFVGCPFGLSVLPSHFQRCMQLMFSDFRSFTFPYLDNLPYGSRTAEEHLTHTLAIISRCNDFNLKIKPSSIKFCYNSISCLGHVISSKGISISPSKLQQIIDWPKPITGDQMASFLGFVTYIRHHVRNIAELTAGLESVKSHKLINWTPELEESFLTTKKAIAAAPILKFPNLNSRFCLATDASQTGVGGILYQPIDGADDVTGDNIVSICSKKLSDCQTRYSTYKKELFAIIYSLRQFHSFLWGKSNTILFTDHKPLIWMFESEKPSVALQGWLDIILEYKFKIIHRPGVLNVMPDLLSRMYTSLYTNTWGVPNKKYDFQYDSDGNIIFNQKEGIIVQATKITKTTSDGGRNAQAKAQASPILSSEVQAFIKNKKVPNESERNKLIEESHAYGHFGRDAIFKHLVCKKGVYWAGMRKDIERIIDLCDSCNKFTVSRHGYHPSQFIFAEAPWQHIQIDCSVHLPKSADDFTTLLIIIDVFSGFIILRALKSTSAESIAKELWNVFSIMGIPQILQSDNGPENQNEIVRCLLKLIGVEHRFISPYNPRADGKVERSIQTVMMIIKKLLNGTNKHWPLFVSFAQYCFNQKISHLTGSSPFSLMFTRHANTFSDYSQTTLDSSAQSKWQESQKQILSLIYPAIQERVLSQKSKMIQDLDEQRSQLLKDSVPTGTMVMLKDIKRTNKFEPKYVGPYVIVRRSRNGAYVLKDAAGDLLDRHVPVDQMKILKHEVDHEQSIYEVDKITKHRGKAGQYEYYTYWKNYKDGTWEKENNFFDHRPIQQYWKMINK